MPAWYADRRPKGGREYEPSHRETFEPKSSPPVPGLAPWPIVSSIASAWRRCWMLMPYRLGKTS